MTDRRVLLVAHTGRIDIASTAAAAAARLADGGIELVSLAGESGELDLAVFDPGDTSNGPIELVLALGGDGTLLSTGTAEILPRLINPKPALSVPGLKPTGTAPRVIFASVGAITTAGEAPAVVNVPTTVPSLRVTGPEL